MANRLDLTTQDRFLQEGPGEQSSVLVIHKTGTLSISKDCRCVADHLGISFAYDTELDLENV